MALAPGTYRIVNQGWELTADIDVHGPKVNIGAQLIATKSNEESNTQKFIVTESKSSRMRPDSSYTIQPADASNIYVSPVGPFSGSQLHCTNKSHSWDITVVTDDDEEGSFDGETVYKIQSQDGPIPIPRFWTLANGQDGEHLVAQVGQTTGHPGITSWSFIPVDEDSD